MSVPQQTAVMQAATLRCPPNVFRERYSLADFDVTHTYGEGPNWSICAARCKWSNAPVVLQIYAEVGNLSGCMGLALAAAHGLTHHSSLLPLYAVFRDVPAPSGGQADGKGNGGAAGSTTPRDSASGAGNGKFGGSMACADKVVMVYPGGPAQHPLDTGALGSSSLPPGSGPPVSERGVVRGLLQPLAEMISVLGPMGLRPPYVCGLDVWMDSPEAPGPGQALFMVPLMCHRWSSRAAPEFLPAAVPYVTPYLRDHPAAAGDQDGRKEDGVKRWLSWSAAALVYTVLIGSPPPDKAATRKARDKMPSDPPAGPAAWVPQLPPLAGSNGGPARGGMMLPPGAQRQSGSGTPSGLTRTSGSGNSSNGGGGGAGGESSNTGNHRNNCVSVRSPRRNARAADPMPLWLSDEAGDWFRRGLSLDCMSRAPLDEQLKHPWVFRHAVPRSITFNGVTRRESLNYVPRELHPLMLDVVPMGLARLAREEVDHLMAEMAMTEAPSVAKPAMPWQVVEGPQVPNPEFLVVDEFTQDNHDAEAERDMSVVERYEVAEEEKEDGTRIIEELRVVSGKADGALSRAAKALQAAMARRAETGQWVMVNPRGTTFDDIARQKEANQQRVQTGAVSPQPPVVAKRRESNGSVGPQAQATPKRSPERTSQAAPTATTTTTITTATNNNNSATAFSRSAPVPAASGPSGRNKSPGPKGAKGPSKNGKAAK